MLLNLTRRAFNRVPVPFWFRSVEHAVAHRIKSTEQQLEHKSDLMKCTQRPLRKCKDSAYINGVTSAESHLSFISRPGAEFIDDSFKAAL